MLASKISGIKSLLRSNIAKISHKHIKIRFMKCLNIFNFNKAYD